MRNAPELGLLAKANGLVGRSVVRPASMSRAILQLRVDMSVLREVWNVLVFVEEIDNNDVSKRVQRTRHMHGRGGPAI